jgi:hypothetical protein
MPPRLAMLGVIGGPLIFLSAIAVLFGAYEQDGLHALFSLPEGLFEAAFAIYLIVKGFRPSPILDDARFTGGDGGSCALRRRRSDARRSSAVRADPARREQCCSRYRAASSPSRVADPRESPLRVRSMARPGNRRIAA